MTDATDDDFRLPPGAAFSRVLFGDEGQILATLEPNDDGNASIVLRRWTPEGLAELRLGIAGARAPKSDELFVANFAEITAERALAAFRQAAS